MKSQAIYDNEREHRRELWRDEKLIGSVTPEALQSADFTAGYEKHPIYPALVAGGWSPGEVRGDPHAIPLENRP